MLELPGQCERAEHNISYLSESKQGPEDANRVNKKPGRPNSKHLRLKETNKKNIAIVVDPVGTWVEIQTALLEVRLVGSVNDKIILLVAAKPNHKNLGLINHKKNHMQIGIKLIYCSQNK